MAATHVEEAKHVHLEVWPARHKLHLRHQIEGVRGYGEWQLYAQAEEVYEARSRS